MANQAWVWTNEDGITFTDIAHANSPTGVLHEALVRLTTYVLQQIGWKSRLWELLVPQEELFEIFIASDIEKLASAMHNKALPYYSALAIELDLFKPPRSDVQVISNVTIGRMNTVDSKVPNYWDWPGLIRLNPPRDPYVNHAKLPMGDNPGEHTLEQQGHTISLPRGDGRWGNLNEMASKHYNTITQTGQSQIDWGGLEKMMATQVDPALTLWSPDPLGTYAEVLARESKTEGVWVTDPFAASADYDSPWAKAAKRAAQKTAEAARTAASAIDQVRQERAVSFDPDYDSGDGLDNDPVPGLTVGDREEGPTGSSGWLWAGMALLVAAPIGYWYLKKRGPV